MPHGMTGRCSLTPQSWSLVSGVSVVGSMMGTVAVSGVGDWPHCSLWSDAVGSSSSRRCGEMVCTCTRLWQVLPVGT